MIHFDFVTSHIEKSFAWEAGCLHLLGLITSKTHDIDKSIKNMQFIKIVSLIAVLFMATCGVKAENPGLETLSTEEFKNRLAEDTSAYLLDVRTPDEFSDGHLAGAHLLNWLDPQTFKTDAENLDKSKTIYVYCRSGRRSNEAGRYLVERGYHVVDMDGGILAWEKAGFPVSNDSGDK